MPTLARHLLEQGPVLGALGKTALGALAQRFGQRASAPPTVPGPELRRATTAPSAELVRDYVRHVGGDPGAYRGTVPPHLFPQWTFPVAARTLDGLPYPLVKVVNGGSSVRVNHPIRAGEPIEVRAHLAAVDDDGRRVVLRQRVVTGTRDHAEALVADIVAIVPLSRGPREGGKRPPADRPTVPADAREVAFFRIGKDAGADFAKLTGDVNPIHWLAPYARASGFRSPILHGFATLARAWEGLNRAVFAGDARALRAIDVRFTRPLALPARVGLYVARGEQGGEQGVYVGDAPGGPAYLTGTFEGGGGR